MLLMFILLTNLFIIINMAKQEIWDFECPQYVDFKRELDNSGKEDVFFDCKDKSPENGNLSTPVVEGKGKGLAESDENRLLGKMTAALSLLENTPKIKKSASRGKLFPGSVSKGMTAKATKSTIKPKTVPGLRPKSRRSKGLDHLNKIINKGKKCRLRKSSSLNDLKTYKLKYPVTPMCLKRTVFKAKDKIVKTTEEMELEQIAKLQKQLIQHLRQNEISLKRLNLRPRQCTVSKAMPKSENVKGVFERKSYAVVKIPRQDIQALNQAVAKKDALKLEPKIKNETISSKKTDNTIYSRKSQALSIASSDLSSHVLNPAASKKEPSKQDKTTMNEATASRQTIYSKKLSIVDPTKLNKADFKEAISNKTAVHSRAQTLSTADSSKLDNPVISQTTASRRTIYSRRAQTLSTADSSKLDNLVISETTASKRTMYTRKAKTLSATDSNLYKNIVQETKKTVYKRIMDHSGLMFIPSVKNNLSVKSFIFEEKTKEKKPQAAAAKQKETTAVKAKENQDKENNACVRSQFSSKEMKGAQNANYDTNKLAELNRITRKQTTNPLRGVPLAENISRD